MKVVLLILIVCRTAGDLFAKPYNKNIPEQLDSINYAAIKEFAALLPVQQSLTRKLAEFALIEMTA